jgi:putative DNA primase/helicase
LLKGHADVAAMLAVDALEEPKARRYIVNDTTYEALGEVLAANPNGVLAFRDELVSLLKTLDREEYAAARGFFLTAWSGTSGYTFDRVTRGRTYLEAACVSLVGSTQPGRIAEYMRRAISGGAGDDGLIQRFSLLVWPDQSPEWKSVDRFPDSAAREAAWETFHRLDALEPLAIGAETDKFQSNPFLRFDDHAQGLFAEWREDLEIRLRSADLSPSFESHLAKYRKLVPALALINHLADRGDGPIEEASIRRSLAFAGYLETHARRAYGAGSESEATAAKAILARIRKSELSDGFTARDIYRREWASLTDRDHVLAGLDLLVDLDWLASRTAPTTGRARVTYWINPRAKS